MCNVKRATHRSPVFIHSAACARKRRPITSIKITAIAQRNGQQFCKVGKHYRVATNLGAKGDVLQYLGDYANAVIRHRLQDVKWGLGIDEQGGLLPMTATGRCLVLILIVMPHPIHDLLFITALGREVEVVVGADQQIQASGIR